MKIGGWRMVGNGRSYADSAPVSTVSEMALQLIGHGVRRQYCTSGRQDGCRVAVSIWAATVPLQLRRKTPVPR